MSRNLYRAAWVLEVAIVMIVALIVALPIQDYERREFGEWYRHPSRETLQKLQEKRQEEFRLRCITAAPFAAAAVILPFFLRRIKPSSDHSVVRRLVQ